MLGFGTMFDEMEIGDWTNEINRMIVEEFHWQIILPMMMGL